MFTIKKRNWELLAFVCSFSIDLLREASHHPDLFICPIFFNNSYCYLLIQLVRNRKKMKFKDTQSLQVHHGACYWSY